VTRYIDAHTHAFPAPTMGLDWQASVGVADPKRTGELPELQGIMSDAGIEQAVILLFPRSGEHYERARAQDPSRSPEEIRSEIRDEILALNRWGCEAASRDPRLVPFIGINVRFMSESEVTAEIDEMAERGARGVKIIPPAMQLYANDSLLQPMFQRCWELGLPVLSQSGDGGGPPPHPGADPFGRPVYHREVLRNFPSLTLILAHMGHGYLADVVELADSFPNLYTDTSLQLSGIGREGRPTALEFVSAVRQIGVDRVLFGTNYPMVSPRGYVKTMEELPFTPAERDLVASGNFLRAVPARQR